jgi:hypothetical protein
MDSHLGIKSTPNVDVTVMPESARNKATPKNDQPMTVSRK